MLSNKLLYFWDFTRNLLVSRNVLYNIYTCFFFFWLCHAQHAGSKFPDQGSNLCPPWWKRGTLITGLPGNFLQICYKELFSTEIFRWAEYTIYNSVHHWEVYLAESEVLGSSYFSKEEKKKKKKLSELPCSLTVRDVPGSCLTITDLAPQSLRYSIVFPLIISHGTWEFR